MSLTAEQILQGLGIDPSLYAGKTAELADWNGKLASAETEAASKIADATRKLQDAEALKRVIDDNIAQFGVTEANTIQLQAANAAYKAAFDELQKQGISGINLPQIVTPPAQTINDPAKELLDKVTKGFTQIGQTMRVQNQYFQLFGKALPDDPATLADEAAQRRMSVEAYAEQKYGFAAEKSRQQQEAQKKHDAEVAAAAVKQYQEANPNTSGNPNLSPGVPSNFGNMPKPREGKTVREFAGMTSREKVANALQRATEAAKSQVTQ